LTSRTSQETNIGTGGRQDLVSIEMRSLQVKKNHPRSEKISEHEESHRITAERNQKDHQFAKVVNSRINPSTPLREQNTLRLGTHSMHYRIWAERGLECRKMFHYQRRHERSFRKDNRFFLCSASKLVLGIIDYAIRNDEH